jgi:hypothetical protein
LQLPPDPTALTTYSANSSLRSAGQPTGHRTLFIPYTALDGDGKVLSGANKYTLTFAKGHTPPVDGFWSITMYFDGSM